MCQRHLAITCSITSNSSGNLILRDHAVTKNLHEVGGGKIILVGKYFGTLPKTLGKYSYPLYKVRK